MSDEEKQSQAAPIWMNNTSWRESGRMVKFFIFDGRLMIFILLCIMFPKLYLFILTLIAMLFFYFLEYIGYTLPNAIRKILIIISGKKKNGVHYWRQLNYKK